MELKKLLTGSFPIHKEASQSSSTGLDAFSIQDVVQEQIKADLDVLVDGQLRSNIVGIFAAQIGLHGVGLPYRVRGKLGTLKKAVTLPDLEIAASEAKGRPLKAHITGPTVIAESCLEDKETPQLYRGESGFRQLTLDIAAELSQEAKFIASREKNLNIQYLQIDEPSLAYGANLELAREALAIIAQGWRGNGGGEIILHVCGDIRDILGDLAEMPVDILNIENVHLREASEESLKLLRKSNKKLALGIVAVNTDKIPTPQRLAQELVFASDRYGKEHLWGITPNCGLRLSSLVLVSQRIACMREAANILKSQSGRLA